MGQAPPAAAVLAKILEERGCGQNEAAKMIGVRPSTFSRWMTGGRRLTDIAVALRIQELFGVAPELWHLARLRAERGEADVATGTHG